MKVLMIHHGKGIGGAPKSMSYVAKALVENGVEVEVLFLQKSNAIELFQDINCKKTVLRYPVYYFYHMSKWVKFWQIHKLLAQAASLFLHLFWVAPLSIKKAKPDVVYINSSVLPEWIVAAKLLKKKVVVHVREAIAEGHFGLRRRIISLLTRKFSDKIIFISVHNMKRMMPESAEEAHVVYNYEPEDLVRESPVKVYDFIYVGGESYIKGWSLIQTLLKSDLDFKLLLAGAYSEDVFRSLSSDKRVTLLGVSNNLAPYIAASRFLISPFLEPHFSRPIIEAYALGTVPIATNIEGVEEQITNDTGFLFDKDDLKEFFRVVEICLSISGADYNALASAGGKMFYNFFSSKNELKIVSLIRSL